MSEVPVSDAKATPQNAAAVLMVRPAGFGFNPQTAPTNAFQQYCSTPHNYTGAVLREFTDLATDLDAAGVTVIIADDTATPVKPDAIFPNNWVSFHDDGTVVLYPMLAVNRRWERREQILAQVANQGGFQVSRTVDLSHHENAGHYLEGTGSLVLDRVHRIAYACLSPRTDLGVLGDFAQQLDYEVLAFGAADTAGQAIYHTNVLMAVGTRFAVFCSAAIRDPDQRAAVVSKLQSTGHELLEISLEQMHRFAGNLLELRSPAGPIVAVSATAFAALSRTQRRILEKYAGIICVGIPTIEHAGGGSVRCMLAEIHLPRRP